jgi:hypothetical protein
MKNGLKLSSIFMIISATLILLSFSIPSFISHNNEDLFAKSDSLTIKYPQEKIYLHFDRPSYWAGDDIWFKAYLKNTAIPNCNLYVELLDSTGNVVYKDICWAMRGIAYGDFHLEDTISSGIYQIRAYTSWMRNFDEQWFFRRDQVIWNLRDKAKAPEYQKLRARQVNIDFMPEGGTFLAGVKNRVAFKITDDNGKGLEAEGIVIDEDRNTLAEIKSGFMGMGNFDITPQPGKKYTAEVTVAGNIPKTIDLPVATETGVSVRFNPEDTTQIYFEINAQPATSSTYILTGQSEGKICYNEEINLAGGKTEINIDKNNFPTGIVRFTLFDENMLPQCERLVFVDHHDQITVNIKPDKATFKPREKITLDLIALGKGNQPALSNLSLSAYHIETTGELKTYPENIMTSFLLSSELKGRIEEPAYYFKDDSLSTVIALDNVMLTHGYRYFTWEEVIENKQPEISFQPDSSIEIKGQVVSLLFRKPVEGGKVTMITLKGMLTVQEQITDSEGNFKFSNLYFYDTVQVAIDAVNQNGNRNTDILIDDKVSTSPKTGTLPLIYQYSKETPSQTVTYLSELDPELLNKKWHLSDTILIGDVNVVALKREENDKFSLPKPYDEPAYTLDIKELRKEFMNLSDMIESSAIARSLYARVSARFVDGISTSQGALIPPVSMIDKIEFVRMAPIPGGFGPAVFFWTIRGTPNERMEQPPGVTPLNLVGYSFIRNFYAPVYDGSQDNEKTKEDYRSTLYWDPAIETNIKGDAEVTFYNSDQTGEVRVVVEGVTKDGRLCRGIGSYEVIY